MSHRITALALCSVCCSLLTSAAATAQEPAPPDPAHAAQMARGLAVFKQTVRPILTGVCLKCHGGDKVAGGLDLTTRELLLRGGESGPAIVVGKSSESVLFRLVAHQDEPFMPEEGAKLSDVAVQQIGEWIDLGAPFDKPLKSAADDDPLAWTTTVIDDSRREFWSFRPLAAVSPPAVANNAWVQTNVDRFLATAQAARQIEPSTSASRATLIRRAYFDLLGLPPPAAEVAAFVADDDPAAWPRLIDRLLDSPHYGERWGRHWLDVARFGESHGFEQDYDRPHAYHYRDFVIQALNQDLPYDQFVRWQIAGDELASDQPLAWMATGFLGAGVFPTQLTEKEFESARYDELDDMASTLGTAMLGLTIGCARCHDHKYDPIPAADYYHLIAHFTTAIRSHVEFDLAPAEYQRKLAAWEAAHQPLATALQATEADGAPLRKRFDALVQGAELADEQRTKLWRNFREQDRDWAAQHQAVETSLKSKPQPLTPVMVVSEGVPPLPHHADGRGFPHFYPETYFVQRGDVNQKQGPASPRPLQVLTSLSDGADASSYWRSEPPPGAKTSWRRAALAHWLTDVEHGAGRLLARVIVNRLWHWHFGRGIVATPSDFGFQGSRPTHPELLDWLAGRLIAEGWRLKPIHRLIMTSAVYRQDSAARESMLAVDPDNLYLWRWQPRRLEAESIRDAMLAASGRLDRRQFGPGSLDPAMTRRSVYFTIKRSQLIARMQIFDVPEPLVGSGVRPATTIAPQALLFMNDQQVRLCAEALAEQMWTKSSGAIPAAVDQALRETLGRPASPAELAEAAAFIDAQAASYLRDGHDQPLRQALSDFCQAVFGLNEFIYIP